ncbi:MAG: hypothetical protein AAB690_01890 [Patescibacteria group bacterium]
MTHEESPKEEDVDPKILEYEAEYNRAEALINDLMSSEKEVTHVEKKEQSFGEGEGEVSHDVISANISGHSVVVESIAFETGSEYQEHGQKYVVTLDGKEIISGPDINAPAGRLYHFLDKILRVRDILRA